MRLFKGALCLILTACLLAGCGKSATVITIVEPTDPNVYNESAYAAPGYYAPENQDVYTGQIAPAPASIENWTQEQAQAQISAPQEDATAGSMTRGDVTCGVVVGEYAAVNPLSCVYRDLYSVNALVFESLVELDENMRPVPLLADTWTVEGNVWTFTLRSGIQFHNGAALTAQDVVASYEEAMNNPSTYWYPLVSQIDAMEALDELTVRVRSKGAGYMFLYAMTFPVLEAGTVRDELPMGTGPFWYMNYNGSALRLESNPLWWKRASGYVESIVAICYRTTKAALVGLELGEIDALATDYPTASLNRSLSDRMTIDYSTQTYECIVPNLRNNILSDLSVRQALMYAIDRQTLGDKIYAGMVQESEVPVVPGSWIYDPQATRFNFSPERALQLLYNAGWADQDQNGVLEKEINGKMRTLSLELLTYDRGITSTRSEAAETIARQLRLVGFDVTVVSSTAGDVQKAMDNGKYDLALCAFELDVMPNLTFLLHSDGKGNFARYQSPEMNGYLHDAYIAADADALVSAMSNLQIQVVEDLPVLGLFFRAGVLISMESVGGLTGTRQYDVLRGMATITPTN